MKDKESSKFWMLLKTTHQSWFLKRISPAVCVSVLSAAWAYLATKDFLESSVESYVESKEISKVVLKQSDIDYFSKHHPGFTEEDMKRALYRIDRISNERAVGQQTQQYFGDKNRFEE